MNVLIIGSGGREHAITWKIKQSPLCEKIYVAPGNGGTKEIAINLDINVKDFSAVRKAVVDYEIGLVVVGPEEPLVNGMVDDLKTNEETKGVLVIGPAQAAAKLEGSKEFSKDFMTKYGVPTAKAKTFDSSNIREGYQFLEELKPPYVLKADGLAAGKGVLITEDLSEAKANLDDLILNKRFGDASARVLIEEFLSGIELSVFVLTDGKDFVVLPEAKDYKRIGEGDEGPNTGGMGAVSPVIFADKQFMNKVVEKVIKPTVKGIESEGMDYCGFIFFGLMNNSGEPEVIEYNVRMGDPETEVVMPRIKSDLLEVLIAAAEGRLNEVKLELEPFTATTVVMVSGGYPGDYEKGREISFKKDVKGSIPFHAGTAIKNDTLVTNGGRVIAVTGLGKNMGEALNRSYSGVDLIEWEGKNYRKDIGFDLQRLGQ
ncbi:phosphoribosylamine--glycine ligase [Marinoscillum sp. MHG1-6]|uniref:phosphoribosylamine--glycine ligase n=1 Tax=Marinoscillum sp. MHG1-6 TaxID=2959627 RepID=UPI002157C110|nr:phosphoribosylamine--glycine ligase [Marinoscillum sp. MHG1-6]